MDPIQGFAITTIDAAIEQSRVNALAMADQINAARTAGYKSDMALFLQRLAAKQTAPTNAPPVPVSVAAVSFVDATVGRVFWTWTDTTDPVCPAIPVPADPAPLALSQLAHVGKQIPGRPGCWYKLDTTIDTALVAAVSDDGVTGWWQPHFIMAALGYYTLEQKVG